MQTRIGMWTAAKLLADAVQPAGRQPQGLAAQSAPMLAAFAFLPLAAAERRCGVWGMRGHNGMWELIPADAWPSLTVDPIAGSSHDETEYREAEAHPKRLGPDYYKNVWCVLRFDCRQVEALRPAFKAWFEAGRPSVLVDARTTEASVRSTTGTHRVSVTRYAERAERISIARAEQIVVGRIGKAGRKARLNIKRALSDALYAERDAAASIKRWRYETAEALGIEVRKLDKWVYAEALPSRAELLNLFQHFGPDFANRVLASTSTKVIWLDDPDAVVPAETVEAPRHSSRTKLTWPRPKIEGTVDDVSEAQRSQGGGPTATAAASHAAGKDAHSPKSLALSVDPYRTGAQGRPTIRHLICKQFDQRARLGEVLQTLAAEARALHDWAEKTHAEAPSTTAKTIENNIRSAYRQHKAANATKTPTK